MIPDNALNGNDISNYQSMAKTYEITKLLENIKFSLKCSEHLVFKLFLIQLTKYHDTFGTSWPQELPVEHMVVQ